MQSEIEVKFLNIDHAVMRAKLEKLGAVCEQPERLMRRVLLDYPDGKLQQKWGRLRVRDEGDKVTLTYKEPQAGSHYSGEVETVVASFNDTVNIMKAIGLEPYSYQESRRETWQIEDCEIVLDEWPWVAPYIEIEGPSEEAIKSVTARLGLDWSAAGYGSVDTVYHSEYPKMKADETIGAVSQVRFGEPVPPWLLSRK